MDFKFFLGIFQILEGEIYTQKRKVRGKNHNKKVSGLKNGEKLPIVFYNNRAVEENHQSWSRHLGRIVRNPNICPIRVKSWKEIGKKEKDHMWESVKVHFLIYFILYCDCLLKIDMLNHILKFYF